jgi:hypothetical protein
MKVHKREKKKKSRQSLKNKNFRLKRGKKKNSSDDNPYIKAQHALLLEEKDVVSNRLTRQKKTFTTI